MLRDWCLEREAMWKEIWPHPVDQCLSFSICKWGHVSPPGGLLLGERAEDCIFTVCDLYGSLSSAIVTSTCQSAVGHPSTLAMGEMWAHFPIIPACPSS